MLKREFSLLLIVTDDLGNSLLSNNFEAFCNANNPSLTSSVRKRSSALCSPTSAWNSDAQYCVFNTKSWAKLGIWEISDSKNFGFSATSTSKGKRVLDFFSDLHKTILISFPMSYWTSSNSQNSSLWIDLKKGGKFFPLDKQQWEFTL